MIFEAMINDTYANSQRCNFVDNGSTVLKVVSYSYQIIFEIHIECSPTVANSRFQILSKLLRNHCIDYFWTLLTYLSPFIIENVIKNAKQPTRYLLLCRRNLKNIVACCNHYQSQMLTTQLDITFTRDQQEVYCKFRFFTHSFVYKLMFTYWKCLNHYVFSHDGKNLMNV